MTSVGAGTAFGRYREVLRTPQVPRLVASMVAGRLPNGMLPLGIVLLVHQQQGSYAVSGATLAALMVGTTGSAPFRGRAIDRWGQSRILCCLSLIQAAALGGFIAGALTREGAPVLMSLAVIVGATNSTLGGAMRALWPVLVERADHVPAAYALQALLEDLISIGGPLVGALLITAASPAAVLVVAGLAGLAGTTAFATAPASRSMRGRPKHRTGVLGVLGTRGMRALVITLASAGVVIGVLNVTVPAFAQDDGDSAAAGVLLAAMSASSAVSGLCYGARTWTASAGRRFVRLAGVFAVLVAPLAAAQSLTQLGGLLVLVGFAYAPRMISAYLLLDELAPHHARTEAYTWLVTANAGGVALGSALAGPVVQDAGVHWAFGLAAVSAALGLAVAIVRRSALEAGPDDRATP